EGLAHPVLWLTEPDAQQVQVFDPVSKQVIETLPFAGSSQPWGIASSGSGVWVTWADTLNGEGGIAENSFNPFWTQWVPGRNSQPVGVTSDGSGNGWFAAFGTNQVGVVNPNNGPNNPAEFTIPTNNGEASEPYNITLGSDGNLYFTEFMDTTNSK